MLNALKRSVHIKRIAFYIMDVLEPELIWVNGYCYRFYESSAWKNIDTSAPYMEDIESVCSDEESDTNMEIVSCNGQFKNTFKVPKVYYPHIIGANGMTRKKLENETKTTIDVPKKGKDGNIVITASDQQAVISARHRIDLLIANSRKKICYTHFLSIPLNKKEIIDKYNSFKDDVLKKYNKTAYNIDESLFQMPSKLHLTIGMLKLLDDDEKKQAIDALLNCKEEIIDPFLEEFGPLNIQLQGVECMNDDPTEVNVLFAQITHNEKLQELIDKIADYFVDIGLKEKEYETIKLHATLMNTSFKRDYRARSKSKEKFNASEILKVYKDTVFGEIIFNQIDISELKSATKDVAYAVTESDIIEINDGISTIFCSEHTLQMNDTFNAFQMAQRPEITSKRKHIRLKKSMNLPDDTLEYWGFYLLKGATVALSVCSRFPGASILVVKGERNLRTCGLLEHNINKEQAQDIYLPGANKVKIIYQSNAQEIDSKESIMIEPINIYNTTNVHISLVNVSSEKPVNRNEKVLINTNNNTLLYKSDKNLKDIEALYDSAASYIQKHIGDQQESMNRTRKLRHLRHRNIRKNKNKKIKLKKIHMQDQDREMHRQKLERELHSDNFDEIDVVKQKVKLKDEMNIKRFRRNRELINPSLLDQGIRHGGNADKNFTSNSNESSSVSSFENGLFNCYGGAILLAYEFEPSNQCTDVSYLLNSKHTQANHHVEEDGYYYYIFYSDNDIVSNDIYTIFDIYKPTFQYENVSKSCINRTECSFTLSPLSGDRIIVEIPTKDGIEHNEMDDTSILISICQPRMGAYMFFPIAILLLILGCAFM
ncbi:uncharacterized protein LOC126858419 [Cataglyphis hispanica]|uniref:uncharacterized protein LOC126858419 n=1 Tax=Cataglyphis hispanica TaxID=1086592 RepID=UPI00217F7212|nr:uncharacterized protein LOC126858419 [Cataglyphis hispanica]